MDVSGVKFLASAGIRLLTANAKSLASRNEKMALLNPISEVLSVLEMSGVPAVIPTYSSIESAEAAPLSVKRA